MGDSMQHAYLEEMARRQCRTVRRYLVLIGLLVVGALAWWYLT